MNDLMNDRELRLKRELRQKTRWCRYNFPNHWTLCLQTPLSPDLIGWITETYDVCHTHPMDQNGMAFLVRTTPKNTALLMELPQPQQGGSYHECNQVSWP